MLHEKQLSSSLITKDISKNNQVIDDQSFLDGLQTSGFVKSKNQSFDVFDSL